MTELITFVGHRGGVVVISPVSPFHTDKLGWVKSHLIYSAFVAVLISNEVQELDSVDGRTVTMVVVPLMTSKYAKVLS